MDTNIVSLSEYRKKFEVKTDTFNAPQVYTLPDAQSFQAYSITDLLAFMAESFIREIHSMGYTIDMGDTQFMRLIPLTEPKTIHVIVED